MYIKTISVAYERRFSLADYESLKVEAAAWAELEGGENVMDAYATLYATVKEAVKEAALPVLRPKQAKVQEVFNGLPVVNEGNGDAGHGANGGGRDN